MLNESYPKHLVSPKYSVLILGDGSFKFGNGCRHLCILRASSDEIQYLIPAIDVLKKKGIAVTIATPTTVRNLRAMATLGQICTLYRGCPLYGGFH